MQRKISLLAIGLFIIVSITLMSFQEEQKESESTLPTIQQLIDQSIEDKLAKYRSSRNKKCRKRIIEKASHLADSTIISRAKGLRVIQDTFNRPLPPDRPLVPELLEPIDSSFPTPLLHKDSLKSKKSKTLDNKLPDEGQ